MQLRQWIKCFNSLHSRLPQTPILFQQSLSLTPLADPLCGFDRSGFISFAPIHGERGSSEPWPQHCRRFCTLVAQGVSANHNDPVQDKAPSDRTRSPGTDLPHNRGSSPANERRVLMRLAPAKRLRRSLPLLLAALDRPVVRPKPNPALIYFRASLFQTPPSSELPS